MIEFCDSLDSQMKELSSEGIGVHVKKAEPFSYDEEEMLWQKGAFGGLKHRKFGARFVEYHASEVNEERCVIHVFKKYMTKRDKDVDSPFDVLYLKPKKVKEENAVWYYKTPAGYNTLRKVVKNLCKEAGIPWYKTNHSLRATTATRGVDMGSQKNWSWKQWSQKSGVSTLLPTSK
ncbi:Zinc finger MYM-type 3 [Paramuricea clavata]|uniref:Zinc finger MYM-type 3 n=1 Tax=Paramuricea clavata TaxID=317549 RepID=A0A6S7IER6_PARCT|nr:Zinc finger MYM-type 3 [Paramuricea clavata]